MEQHVQTLEEKAINALRILSIDAVEQAHSGHPGLPMDAAPMAYVLWMQYLRHNPADPQWPDRDRFVLSAGHGSMLLYSLLYLCGYGLTLDDLKAFRQWGSRTPGHPEYGLTPGVEATTGPLGQGFAMAVGMAMAEAHLEATFNRPGYPIVDHDTYVLCSDGDLMEGVSAEAASLAGHLKLGRLIVLYDDNDISLDGQTSFSFTEDVRARFAAYGWQTLEVADGNDTAAIAAAIAAARAERSRPTLIDVHTIIGYGAPHKAGTAAAHGSPLGPQEAEAAKAFYGWPTDRTFFVPDEVYAHFRSAQQRGKKLQTEWEALFERYAQTYPDLAKEWERRFAQRLPQDWADALPSFAEGDKPLATREASHRTITALAAKLPELFGGSADLASSVKNNIAEEPAFQPDAYHGRNIWFGVREFAMGCAVNGMALHGGVIPYSGTFLTFSDYMRPAIRLGALMHAPSIYVFSHDSIGLGEDGPTHQPVEHLLALRAIPGLTVFRPADANETAACWEQMLVDRSGPYALVLSRQALPILPSTAERARDGVSRGGYVVWEADANPTLLLLATGSEVALSVDVARQLQEEGISARVLSMVSWERFDRQPRAYRDAVLPPAVKARVAIEAASPLGWERYTGSEGLVIGIDRFGVSAPGEVVMAKYGFTKEAVLQRVKGYLAEPLTTGSKRPTVEK